MNIGFKKVHPDAVIPTYAHTGDAGMDVYAVEDYALPIGKPTLVPTGLVADIPDGYEIQVRSRSGLALKGVTVFNSPGCIDPGFRGEIGVILFACQGSEIPEAVAANKQEWDCFVEESKKWADSYRESSWFKRLFLRLPNDPLYLNDRSSFYEIHKGDRIAQFVVAPVTRCEPVEVQEVSATERGAGGFGSTGR